MSQSSDTQSNLIERPEYKLFLSSRECLAGIKDMISRAQKTIDFEAFYFIPDVIGREILDLLIQKAKQGVRVRLLVDTMGSFSMSRSLYTESLKKAGAHIRFFNSFVPFSKSKKAFWYFRNHRRAIIIDKKELCVGSFCIGVPTIDWIETAILIEGSKSIEQATKTFRETWHKCEHSTFKIGSSSKLSTDCFSYITQAPLQRQRFIYKSLVQDIAKASKSITFITPYIVPDRKLLRSIKKASKKHVQINIITPKQTDSKLADLARNTYVNHLLNKHVRIFFTEKMIHSKVTIIDTNKAYIGTLNLDNVSLRYNYESTIITDSLACVSDLITFSQSILEKEATHLTKENWLKRSFFTKFLETLVWPIRKLI